MVAFEAVTRLSPTPPAMEDSESLWVPPHDSLLLGPVLGPELPDDGLEAPEPVPDPPEPAVPEPDPVALDVSLPPLSFDITRVHFWTLFTCG